MKKSKSEPSIVTITRDIPSIYEGKRIYCVVAEVVNHPLAKEEFADNHLFNHDTIIGKHTPFQRLIRTEGTSKIEQVPGRMAAQAAHAVSKVRHMLLRREVLRADRVAQKNKQVEHWYKKEMLFFFPVTTIILSCRDSFELYHVKELLRHKTSVEFETFKDTNPDVYGSGEVMTALATYPVDPGEIVGILDYLPLWTPKNV